MTSLENHRKNHVFVIVLILLSVTAAIDTVPKASATVVVQAIATGLEAPWSMSFAPNGTLYLTERPGRVRVIKDGTLQPGPLAEINVATVAGGESGLLGLALDPDFNSNKLAYIYYTYSDAQSNLWNRVSSFTETNGQLTNEHILLDGIRGASIHDGGRLKIGPDGKLYITAGDAGNSSSAQDPTSLNGKILRINLDGSIPNDNPFPGSRVYSLGHRNPQGLAWDNNGDLIESEHGPSGYDEINIIRPGKNYGWPNVVGSAGNPAFVDPILTTGQDTWAPSGITYYNSTLIPDWTGKVLVATLRGQHLQVLDISTTLSVVSSVSVFQGVYGRLRDVVQGPDGSVYIATSNRDGRGSPNSGDDKILRITENLGPVIPAIDSELSLGLLFVAAEILILGVPLFFYRFRKPRRAA